MVVSRNSSHVTWQFVLILVGILIVLLILDSIHSASEYNNGICKNCGGHYVFQTAIGHNYTTSYTYKCDKCGNLIEVSDYYGE